MVGSKKPSRGEDIYIARVESYFEYKEYQRGGMCVRLVATLEENLQALQEGEGVPTVLMDISYWVFKSKAKKSGQVPERNADPRLDAGSQDEEVGAGQWYRICVKRDRPHGQGYMYPTFSAEDPVFFTLETCERTNAPRVPAPSSKLATNRSGLAFKTAMPDVHVIDLSSSNDQWEFLAFHVGQGTCCLVTDNVGHGIFIDAGVGTPIKRPDYLTNNAIKQQLVRKISGLETIDVILSHLDADHWRLIAWDQMLRDKIRTVFVPSGQVNGRQYLALQDRTLVGKIASARRIRITLGQSASIEACRSMPANASASANDNCLVTVYERDGSRVLQPGDYVYRKMNVDGLAVINQLQNNKYAAIVVPHHGDVASSEDVFAPEIQQQSIAFFPAGNHRTYRHPRSCSINAHGNFSIADYSASPSITSLKLL